MVNSIKHHMLPKCLSEQLLQESQRAVFPNESIMETVFEEKKSSVLGGQTL